MVKRTCPSCGKPVYSADTFSEYWACCYCGAQISKESEEPACQKSTTSESPAAK
ncbi:MAG TPA: hypothetical protein GXX46_02055 [Peptococcaceae bacterium]|nr:hypothetical protein [Peptococcaceae bacterium]